MRLICSLDPSGKDCKDVCQKKVWPWCGLAEGKKTWSNDTVSFRGRTEEASGRTSERTDGGRRMEMERGSESVFLYVSLSPLSSSSSSLISRLETVNFKVGSSGPESRSLFTAFARTEAVKALPCEVVIIQYRMLLSTKVFLSLGTRID